jgi:hypothetical protein
MLKKGLVFSVLFLFFSLQAPPSPSCCSSLIQKWQNFKQKRAERAQKVMLYREVRLRIMNLQYLIYFAETRFGYRKGDQKLLDALKELVDEAKQLLQDLITNNMVELWNQGEAESVTKLMWMVNNYNDSSKTQVPINL